MTSSRVVVSAVVFTDTEGRLLTVRKRGTETFMLPGGKPEPGESASEAAVREVGEELGVDLVAKELRLIGTFTTAAANEADHDVEATLFSHHYVAMEEPVAEIEETRWLDVGASPLPGHLAPLLTEVVVPWLRQQA